MTRKILVIDDDKTLSTLLKRAFKAEKYDCETAATARDGLLKFSEKSFDAVVLDLKLEKKSGTKFLMKIRRNGDETPIIVLSSIADPAVKILHLRAGANDYLEKPFLFEELLARLETIFRDRASPKKISKSPIKSGNLTLFPEKMTAKLGQKKLDLTPREFEILEILMRKKGETLTRDEIWRELFGTKMPKTNALDVHLMRIRRKIGADRIRCLPRRGFFFVE